jgi:hypothetical protein
MNRCQLGITAVLVAAASPANGQTGSLQQSVSSKFTLTEITRDRSAVVTTGTPMVLQRDDLLMYTTACPSAPINSYNSKKGKLSQPFGKSFLRDLGGSMLMAGNATTASCPQRRFVRGTKLWVTKIDVQKDGILFHLYSTPDNDIAYYGDLKFPFEKNSIPTADQALTNIAEVLTIQPAETSSNGAPPAQAPDQATQATLAGTYFMQQTGSTLNLDPDGSFSMQAANGQVSPGRYYVIRGRLILTYTATAGSTVYTIQGDKMYANTGLAWVRQGEQALAPIPPPPPPPAAAVTLPATYVSAQVATDQLQLNPDNSFSLQAAGESYHGTFVVKGSTVELSIRETGDKTTATIQGSNLTDSSGQTWARREQSAETAPGAVTLGNQDIIKMVKAGLGDDLIIAKIGGSKCQFDTSTDALIQLKQSGVSPAVLKAIVGAGK